MLVSNFVFKTKLNVFGILRSYKHYCFITKINNFRGHLTDASARDTFSFREMKTNTSPGGSPKISASGFVLADMSVRSPGKLYDFRIINHIAQIGLSDVFFKIKYIYFLDTSIQKICL